jgi:hypothetical protein
VLFANNEAGERLPEHSHSLLLFSLITIPTQGWSRVHACAAAHAAATSFAVTLSAQFGLILV